MRSVLVYLFPIFVVLWHLFKHTSFLLEHWVFYVFGLLVYTYIDFLRNEEKENQHFVRKVYFLQAWFFLLFVFPDLSTKYNIWGSGNGFLGLNKIASTSIVIFIVSFILYLALISDFHVSEILLVKQDMCITAWN